MHIHLKKLYSEPATFDPLVFHDGVNIILGERSEEGNQERKQNGVGKSLVIEFLRFALLAEFSKNRVSRIPKGVLPEDTVIILEATINGSFIQIRRSILHHENVELIVDGTKSYKGSRLDIQQELQNILFSDITGSNTSLRALLAILMREELSNFQDILTPYNPKNKIPADLRPHLMFLGIPSGAIAEMQSAIRELETKEATKRDLKKRLLEGDANKIEDIPAMLSEERQSSSKIDAALKSLQADPAFESAEEELAGLERDLNSLRAQRRALTYRIKQIESIPLAEQVTARDMKSLFDGIKDSLGEFVEKSFEEVRAFQHKIEAYQYSLRKNELKDLYRERTNTSQDIASKSHSHGALVQKVDKKGILKELEIGYDLARKKSEDYYISQERYNRYEDTLRDIEELKIQRSSAIQTLRTNIDHTKETLKMLNETIVDYHQFIQNSARAALSFTYAKSASAKRPVGLHFSAQDDGSKSVNMIKVFIYDLALMLSPATSRNHPGLLIHDNILEVDQDTIEKSLNLLGKLHSEDKESFQYIITLNSDKVMSEESLKNLTVDIDSLKIASLTKDSQFLKRRYEEVSKT